MREIKQDKLYYGKNKILSSKYKHTQSITQEVVHVTVK